MKDLVMITHFTQVPREPGNARFNYIAEMLNDADVYVEIITSTFSHINKAQRTIVKQQLDELPYKLTMLYEPGYKRNVSFSRFSSHYIMGKSLTKYLEKRKVPDIIYCAVPSLDVGYVAAKYAKKNDIPFVVDIQDLWPEAFEMVFHIPIISNVMFLPLTVMANKIYRTADKLIAVSQTYLTRGLSVNSKDKEGISVYLGTDLNIFDAAAANSKVYKPDDEVWVVYIGTLGRCYNIEIVIDALTRINQQNGKKLVFKILGDGPYLERLKRYAAKKKVTVDFLGRLKYSDMVAYLSVADIAVNPISKGALQSIINKHGDYAAAGLPVISTQESSEYKKLLRDYQCGIDCGVEDIDAVAKAIETLYLNSDLRKSMGSASRKMAEEKFNRVHTNKQIVAALDSLI